jgi:hypothetical protein
LNTECKISKESWKSRRRNEGVREKKKKNLIPEELEHLSWTPVAYVYNPSYPEGRDQEDHNSRPA